MKYLILVSAVLVLWYLLAKWYDKKERESEEFGRATNSRDSYE